ncbi:facilitated trehalose transporter Tret1-like [Orussus abietinus]|uniref:facilitated trehalose transporter Tret1-like n=1 Tax=Orussus abietinus TaxID=222816 RepID=UPI000625DC44|nr:facilitated trehalose transporter Tret1-like [Orussus abietinus]XP_012271538.1 facilitated trehalose transporter Tret1-like [Orussus abietinus]
MSTPKMAGTDKGTLTQWPQWVAGTIATLALVDTGFMNGWASPYLAQLTSPDSEGPIRMNESQASWVASLMNLGRVFGAFVGVACQELIGRKKTLQISGFPLAFSWVFVIVANSVHWLYAARFCSGIAAGMIWSSLALFLGEIADPGIRGALISLNVNVNSIGSVLGNVLGPFLSMELFAYVGLLPNLLFVVLFLLIPDSPHDHVRNDELEKAEKALQWYRREADVKKEVQELQDFIRGPKMSLLERIKEFRHPGILKAAFVMFFLNFFFYLSGRNTLILYAEIIVTKSEVSLTPSTVVIGLGISTILAGTTATLLVDRFGRRSLLITSSLGTSLALIMLGVHFHFLSSGSFQGRDLSWFPITALVAFNVFSCYGLVPVPSALSGELFPPNVKTLAAFGTSSTSAVMAFLSTKTYQPFVDLVGERYVFWTYGLGVFMTVPFTYFFVPETKGKTLQEIQESLGNPKAVWKNT